MTALAGPVDAHRHGEYRAVPSTDAEPSAVGSPAARPGVVTGPGRFAREAGQYHLYSAAPSPAAHRVEILRLLTGLEKSVSLSRLDGLRDARGWAFRGATGPDPVNGFTLLREAYLATSPGYDGRVDVPVLWDRAERRIATDDADVIVDELLQCSARAPFDPPNDAAEDTTVADAVATITTQFSAQLGPALRHRAAADSVRSVLRRADRRLAERPYLLGEHLTDADVRFWVALVRYDVGVNAHRAVGPELPAYRGVWRWAQQLLTEPAFASTTDVAAFAAPFADLSHWTAPAA